MTEKRDHALMDRAKRSQQIKEAADWRCQQCGRDCYRPDEAVEGERDRRHILNAFSPSGDPNRLEAWCTVCMLGHNRADKAAKAVATRKRNRIRRRIEIFRQVEMELGQEIGSDEDSSQTNFSRNLLYSIQSDKLDRICEQLDPDHPEGIRDAVCEALLAEWGVNDQRRLLETKPADRLADRVQIHWRGAA